MKKLMIAAAAAAMVGGVYASEECPTCSKGEATGKQYNPAFYDVQFKLKTLGTKKVMCGQCELYSMENANRTLNGLYWTCDNCTIPYQYALWEKAGQTPYTDTIHYDLLDASAKYTVEGTYQAAGDYYSTTFTNKAGDVSTEQTMAFAAKANGIFGTKFTSSDVVFKADYAGTGTNALYIAIPETTYKVAVPGEFASEEAAITAAKAYTKSVPELTMVYISAKTTQTSAVAGECYWVADADPFDILLRYGKKGEKVEAYFDTKSYTGLAIAAAGFGTYDTKNQRIKSISGSAVGLIDPNTVCANAGEYAPFCFEADCDSNSCWSGMGVSADDTNTAFTGTWTLKLNTAYPKKGMENIVPSWMISAGTCNK